jgi:hypothetical protein
MGEPGPLERELFRQVASAYDAAIEAAMLALHSSEEAELVYEAEAAFALLRCRLDDEAAIDAYRTAIAGTLRIMCHSFFAVLDGASADSPDQRVVAADLDGRRLAEGLHEHWVAYLMETGRAE